jgi:hypothetical protein
VHNFVSFCYNLVRVLNSLYESVLYIDVTAFYLNVSAPKIVAQGALRPPRAAQIQGVRDDETDSYILFRAIIAGEEPS